MSAYEVCRSRERKHTIWLGILEPWARGERVAKAVFAVSSLVSHPVSTTLKTPSPSGNVGNGGLGNCSGAVSLEQEGREAKVDGDPGVAKVAESTWRLGSEGSFLELGRRELALDDSCRRRCGCIGVQTREARLDDIDENWSCRRGGSSTGDGRRCRKDDPGGERIAITVDGVGNYWR